MNLAQVQEQAVVLDECADASPIVTVKAMLRTRAREFKAAAKAWREALGDGIDETDLEIVTQSAVEMGSRIYWPGFGPGTVLRTTQTGILLDGEGQPQPEWVNVSSSTAPIVCCP